MDGQEVFSQLLHQSEDTILTLMKLETDFVRIIGERMPSLLNSKTASILVTWTTDPEKHGDSGTGKLLNVEDGHSGVTSTLTTMEEPGLGLTINHIPTVEPFEIILPYLAMISVFIFLVISIEIWFWEKFNVILSQLGNFVNF